MAKTAQVVIHAVHIATAYNLTPQEGSVEANAHNFEL